MDTAQCFRLLNCSVLIVICCFSDHQKCIEDLDNGHGRTFCIFAALRAKKFNIN
jgi:hypothetical protein